MKSNILVNCLLQIQTIGPEGDKLVWIVLILIAIFSFFFIIKKKKWTLNLTAFKSVLLVSLQKNKIYHPSVVHLKLLNKSNKAIVIDHPIIRFKNSFQTKAYKIKAVNASAIYPLYLEAGKTHILPIALQPFYDYEQQLKKFSKLRIEFSYNHQNFKTTRYILLKPTLFRKVKR